MDTKYRKELIGKKFNKLKVLKFVEIDKCKHIKYLCICDCGKKCIVSKGHLKSNHTKSCGCLKKEIGVFSNLAKGEAAFNALYYAYQLGAKKRQIKFLLSKSSFRDIVLRNCYYCGSKPKQEKRNSKYSGVFVYNGIDRKNSNKNYHINNCVPCCGVCNRAKHTMTVAEYKGWLNDVIQYLTR